MLAQEPAAPKVEDKPAEKAAPQSRTPGATAPVPVVASRSAAPPPDDQLARLLARDVRGRSSQSALSPIVGRPPATGLIQRLVDRQTFKKATEVRGAVRGTTLSELDKLLKEYDAANTIMGRMRVLHEIVQVAELWRQDHENDKTDRANKRRGPIVQLQADALKELVPLRRATGRTALTQETILTSGPSKYVAKRAASASSWLDSLGKAIGLAIPNPGDSVTGSFEVQIPTDSYGVSFAGFRLKVNASRSDNEATKVRAEVAVVGGAKVLGLADVKGEYGFFLEAHGKSPEHAMQLISFGWYRHFRESPFIPREIPNFMWGGHPGSVGYVRAERWAANLEKESFKREKQHVALSSGVGSRATTNEYVRMGQLAGLSANVGGVASSLVGVSGGVSVNTAQHYDQRSLELAKKGQANVGTPMKERARFHTKNLGSLVTVVTASGTVTLGPLSGAVGGSLELLARKDRKDDKDNKWPEGYLSFSGAATVTLPLNMKLLEMLSMSLKKLASDLIPLTKRLEVKAQKEGLVGVAKSGPGPDQAADTLSGVLNSMPALTSAGLAFTPVPVTLTLVINAGYQFGSFSDGWTFDIQLSQSVGLKANASVTTFEFSKSQRLLRLALPTGKDWKLTVD